MAKDKKKKSDVYLGDRNIEKSNISDLCTDHMQIFGVNNNFMRHIPAVIDGLKPGARRTLVALHVDLPGGYNKEHIKLNEISGKVLGVYHPHGDEPINSTIAGLAQPWNNTVPLIDGYGNFGNQIGDSPAGARYIAARLSFYAYKCFFEDFDMHLVDTKPTYNGKAEEPEYLPSKYPNALFNTTFGIGYAISCGLPTYNFKEVVELTMRLMDNPGYANIVLVPDSPTGADIVDDGNIFKQISETGSGTFVMRARIDIDEEANTLRIRSVPTHVDGAKVVASILDLVKEQKIQGIHDILDNYTQEEGLDYVVVLKKEADPVTVRNILFKKTQLSKSIHCNFKLINDYSDMDLDIRSLLLFWIDFRRETKQRRINKQIKEKRERQHELETTLSVLSDSDRADKVLKLIRRSKNKAEAVVKLMDKFNISSLQAKKVADLGLSAFTEDGIAKAHNEYRDLEPAIADLEKLSKYPKEIDKEIKKELQEGIKLFGVDRRSRIISIENEAKVSDTKHVVVFTLNGFVKKLPASATSIGSLVDGDYPIEITHVRNTTDLLIFDERGKISKLPVHLLQNSDYISTGEPLSKYCTINGRINAVIPKPTEESLEKFKDPVYFLMVTKNGTIKKTLASRYTNIRGELAGMTVREDDELRAVKVIVGDKDVVVYTNKGMGSRFPSSEIRDTARQSMGVKAFDVADGEVVIGMDVVLPKDKFIFCLTNKGVGKKCALATFKTMARAAKPLRIASVDDGEEIIIMRTIRGDEKFNVYLKGAVQVVEMDVVPELPRLSKGRKIVGVRKGEVIIDIKEVK